MSSTSRTLKVIPLALLLILPAASRMSAGDPPGDGQRRIVVNDDGVFTLDTDGEGDDGGAIVLRTHGRLHGGRIGARLLPMTAELRAHYGAPKDAGVLVSEVEPDSPAAKAGLQVGDIITAVDGELVDSPWDLSAAVRGKKGGETVKIEISRDRSPRSVSVAVEESRERWIEPRIRIRDRIRNRIRVVPDVDVQLRGLHGLEGLDRLEDLGTLRERLQEMEKRLKDLEKKMPSR